MVQLKKSNLKRGDVITSVNGKPVDDARALQKVIANIQPEKTITLKVTREGKQKTIKLKLGSLEKEDDRPITKPGKEDKPDKLGLIIGMTSDNKNVQVLDVEPESPAGQADVSPGDIILKVNRKQIKSVRDYKKAVKGLKSKSSILFDLQRGDVKLFLAFRLP